MKCNFPEESIIRLAAGELSGREREEALKHISGCSRCSELYSIYTGLEESLSSRNKQVPPGSAMAEAVSARLTGGAGEPLLQRLPLLPVAISMLILTGCIPLYLFRDYLWYGISKLHLDIMRASVSLVNTIAWWLSRIESADTAILWIAYASIPLIISLMGGWRIMAGIRRY